MTSTKSLLLLCLTASGLAGYAPSKVHNEERPGSSLVETSHGHVGGSTLHSWTGKTIHAFRGLRYARPPLGHLRFKAPEPPKPWTGVMHAVEDGASCPQPMADYYGPTSEDCLFLNLYTKDLVGDKPVIVFFHPGGYFAQGGRSDVFGPQYLLDHDVVLVVVNYRLGALGFLSTGDKEARGNYGLKDQVAALKWVHENIQGFGGNRDQVTIAGNGVGATSVLLHMLSPTSRGLFHKAVAMSGGATGRWVVNRDPAKLAKHVGQLCKCDTSTSQKLVACLRQIPAQSLADHYVDLREWGHDPAIVFGAVVESDQEDGFLTGQPTDIIQSGRFNQVPCVVGVTKNEYEGRATTIMANETLRQELEKEWERLAPIVFYFERGTDRSKAFCKDLRQLYFAGGPVNTRGVSKLYSDALVVYGAESTAKLLAKYSKEPVYFYMSGYQGRYSYNYKKGTKEPYGVMNMDDLLYVLPHTRRFPLFKPNDKEGQMVQTYTSMWSNFANTGDPTPSNVELEWRPLTESDYQYLNLEENCSIKPGLPFKERMDVWEKYFAGPNGHKTNVKPVSQHRPHY